MAQNTLLKNSFLSSILSKNACPPQVRIVTEIRKIKPKMFTKVANWMQKIVIETLQFSFETLEIAYRILIRFLNQVDQVPSNLQLLSCVCLHLASKISQHKIVAISSYMECCMNIFTHEKFVEKENEVYKALNFKIQTETIYKLLEIMQERSFINEEQSLKCKNLTDSFLKDPRSYSISLKVIAISMLVICENQGNTLEIVNLYEVAQYCNSLF